MLEMARLTAEDYLIDLGSGDGRIVIEAAKKRGARGIGVELDAESGIDGDQRRRRRQGVAGQGHVRAAAICSMSISASATVLTMYLLPKINLRAAAAHPEPAASPARASCRTISTWASGSPI